jgi:hypothetical protein
VWSVCTLLYRGYIKALSFIHSFIGQLKRKIHGLSANCIFWTTTMYKPETYATAQTTLMENYRLERQEKLFEMTLKLTARQLYP